MSRRLDHVGIAVLDTERALRFFRDRLGLSIVAVDDPPPPAPAVRLTYLDAGAVTIQLVEAIDRNGPIAAWLARHGEGLHHLCFQTADVPAAIERLSGAAPVAVGSGLGRPAAFVPGVPAHGVRLEFTEPASHDAMFPDV